MKQSKKAFWIRLVLYVLFGGVAPGAFLIWRFDLFSEISSLSIGGWGIVCIAFVGIFFLKMLKAVKEGLPYSFGTQCINGICKIILPLLIALLILYAVQNCITELMQFLGVVIVCEVIAIPLNPIPQWAHENGIKEEEGKYKRIAESLGLISTKK